ncbi:nucleotidyltransferase domain-containing protein [Paenibacillus campinasensis]|uniref:Nucleotidyltransferase n=1 Tax=Paenibacillus campinasensis TaxID=66347 RepID=A0A268EI76_9BACL|nr:nucleotidyltransferase [Paenibacillus campinasensis]PAD72830.1 nucleotidyltransferase [Paenibacillus campinasensis]
MSIPESQLETWAHQGAITSSKLTHERIRGVIDSSPVFKNKGVEIDTYLQGSYRNSTNIRGDSDVDIVVQLNSTYAYNIDQLDVNERVWFDMELSPATYSWEEFKKDLIDVLEDYYGRLSIKVGNKSIKILPGNGRLPADVVPSLQYRHYTQFTGESTDFVEGISFWTTKENRQVINFPKVHYSNGVTKHQNTREKYKAMIRIFKNARSYMHDKGLFDKSLAPGYFIEGLLYNVPNNKFQSSYSNSMYEILNWFHSADFTPFLCQNKQLYLFGSAPEQWQIKNAERFLSAIINLWNDWGK